MEQSRNKITGLRAKSTVNFNGGDAKTVITSNTLKRSNVDMPVPNTGKKQLKAKSKTK